MLEYPFNAQIILKKRKSIKADLLAGDGSFLQKKIAVLGGSTTHDIKDMIELFLLNEGIQPSFYESEYAQYWQDAMFDNPSLAGFEPDIIFIHTSNRNITTYPQLTDSAQEVESLLDAEFQKFSSMWDKLSGTYSCPIIQNNFEYPSYRLLGNQDAYNIHGKTNFITRLNMKFYEYAQTHPHFFINDINYLSADYGLEQWSDPFYWHMYKYCLCLAAIPKLAYSVSNIIKSIFGKNKKAFALDLDNTLWGGVIGDDGADNIEIGSETSMGQAYTEFQTYLKEHKDLGILLNIASKNEHENALAGLTHPDGVIRPEDCIVIKANWEPKSCNVAEMAKELNLGLDSFVFVDDNPAEREIINQQLPQVAAAKISRVEHYIQEIDRVGYFEATYLSSEDLKRNTMYKENIERSKQQASFADYSEYLRSLTMKATVKSFEPLYMSRIAQLTNKSNQFNLTTKRFTQEEIENVAADGKHITLYGRLEDKFGDNGIVSLVVGEIDGDVLHMSLWLMSCRVLKRDMEFAMMDELVKACQERGITKIMGYYYPTAKNGMVRDFYAKQGFTKVSEDEQGNTTWSFVIDKSYQPKNTVIEVHG